MDTEILQRHFARMGAKIDVSVITPSNHRQRSFLGIRDYVLDVDETRDNERFTLTINKAAQNSLQFQTVDIRPAQRHLLLMVKQEGADKNKFLCGHDERHWFVAPVAGGSTNVREAMEALKPAQVVHSQRLHNVKRKNWHKRRNAGFIRQGEWFFIPRPEFRLPRHPVILRYEPLRRAGGKAHIVEEVFRIGGERVYVSNRYPNGVTERQYRRLVRRKPNLAQLRWVIMRRNPQVFGRGKVRHPDHKTVVLPFWHEVAMSGETRSRNVAFLD